MNCLANRITDEGRRAPASRLRTLNRRSHAMDTETTSFGPNPERLAELLGMGIGPGEGPANVSGQANAEWLRAHFAGPLPLGTGITDALPAILGKLAEILLPMGGRSLKDVLLDPETPLAALEKVKSYGKKLTQRGTASHAVGIAIYYTAIASAIIFHDTKISRHSFKYISESLDTMDKDWMTNDLARHIAKARRICQKRAR